MTRAAEVTSRAFSGMNAEEARNVTVRLRNNDFCFNEIACEMLGAEADVYINGELHIEGYVTRLDLNDDNCAVEIVE